MAVFLKIHETIDALKTSDISADRKAVLDPLVKYLHAATHLPLQLVFICTHNSRRSHLAQVWSQAMAAHYGQFSFHAYSGGTEVTAIQPFILEVLRTAGFQTIQLSEGNNPVWAIKFGTNQPPLIGFSKAYQHEINPTKDYAAVMTCDQANETCPFIPGADQRIAITYADPKAYDHTDEVLNRYTATSLQIAKEMKYIFKQLTT